MNYYGIKIEKLPESFSELEQLLDVVGVESMHGSYQLAATQLEDRANCLRDRWKDSGLKEYKAAIDNAKHLKWLDECCFSFESYSLMMDFRKRERGEDIVF